MTIYTEAVKKNVHFQDIPVGAIYCWGNNLADETDHRKKIGPDHAQLLKGSKVMLADDHDDADHYTILELPAGRTLTEKPTSIPAFFVICGQFNVREGVTTYAATPADSLEAAQLHAGSLAKSNPNNTYLIAPVTQMAQHTVTLVEIGTAHPLKIDE